MPTGFVEFVVGGAFDVEEARRIRDQLEALPPDQPVALDFTRARISSLCTLTMFFEEVSHLPSRTIETHGLSAHQLAVLRYCGLDLEALGWQARPLGMN